MNASYASKERVSHRGCRDSNSAVTVTVPVIVTVAERVTVTVTVTGLSPLASIIAVLYLYSDPRSSIYPRLQSPHHTGYSRQQGEDAILVHANPLPH